MNTSTIQRIINSAYNTPKGRVHSKKINGSKERRTQEYWSNVNRISRKKAKRVRYTTHRIEAQPDKADTALENIHYANYLCQKDISVLPQFNCQETITISKRELVQQPEERDQFSAWDDPVLESEALSNYSSDDDDSSVIKGGTLEAFFLHMPEYGGNPEMYELLQKKFMEARLACQAYRELEDAYKLDDNESICSSVDYSYDSHGRYVK